MEMPEKMTLDERKIALFWTISMRLVMWKIRNMDVIDKDYCDGSHSVGRAIRVVCNAHDNLLSGAKPLSSLKYGAVSKKQGDPRFLAKWNDEYNRCCDLVRNRTHQCDFYGWFRNHMVHVFRLIRVCDNDLGSFLEGLIRNAKAVSILNDPVRNSALRLFVSDGMYQRMLATCRLDTNHQSATVSEWMQLDAMVDKLTCCLAKTGSWGGAQAPAPLATQSRNACSDRPVGGDRILARI